MPFRPLNVVGGWYTDDALPWVQQDICNRIPVLAELPGSISAIQAPDAPGLKPFVEIASDGGIRGMRDVEGKLLVVAGSGLYQITNELVAIPRGTIPGTGPVTLSHNQQGIANEVLIGNGSAGYVYNTSTLALNRITDPGFPGTKASDYLDSFLLGVEPLGRFWFHSDLSDAESYNTLDRYEAETSPDRIVTLAVSNEEVVVFGQRTIDFFINTGAATGTFQSKGVSCNVGCVGTNAVVKLDNTLMWLDNYGVFQRLDGYTPVPISTRALESAIAKYKDRWAGVVAATYQDRGRKIAYWTFPDGLTFGYDVTTRLWHRLQSYGRTNFRAPQIVYWNKKWLAGDAQTGRLYELDWDYMLDGDQPHVRRLNTATLHGDGVKLQVHAARLVFDTGGPATVAVPFPEQPTPPTITGSAPDGELGEAYAGFAYTLTGDAPLTVTLVSGVLPQGLEISTAGVINTDATTLVGVFPFTLKVTDRHGLSATHTDDIKIICAPGTIGAAITDTLTIPDNYESAYIYPLANDNLGVVYSQTLLAVGGFYHTREYDSSLTQVGTTVDIEWMAGTPNDDRLFLDGINEAGYGMSGGMTNAARADLIFNGSYQGYYQPDYAPTADYINWWAGESHFSPEYGGLVWFGKDADNVECVYIGVRQTGTQDLYPPVRLYVENVILKFPIGGIGSGTPQLAVAQSVGTTTNPRFWMTRSRSGNIYAITQDGYLQTYDSDLALHSAVALTTPVIGTGNTLRGFGVDGDVLALVYSDGGTITGSGRIEFRNLFTGDLLQSISSLDFAGDQATRVLFTDDSCYVQCRNWVGRIEFTPPQCVLP